jgi:hypothetical protein
LRQQSGNFLEKKFYKLPSKLIENQNRPPLSPEELAAMEEQVCVCFSGIFRDFEDKDEAMKWVKIGIKAAHFQKCESYTTLLYSKSRLTYMPWNEADGTPSEGPHKIEGANGEFYYVKIVVYYTDWNDCLITLVHEIGHLIDCALLRAEIPIARKEEVSIYCELKALLTQLNNNKTSNKSSYAFFLCERLMGMHLCIDSLSLKKPSSLCVSPQSSWLEFLQGFNEITKNDENYIERINIGQNIIITANSYGIGMINAVRLLQLRKPINEDSFRKSPEPITLADIQNAIKFLQDSFPKENE